MIKNVLSSHKNVLNILLLFILMLLFSITVGKFIIDSPNIFLSEDETIYNFYIYTYSETGKLYYTEELNTIADGFVNPSLLTIENQGKIAPRGYLGIIVIYGAIFNFINPATLTIIIGCLGIAILYILVRYMFSNQAALISVFLLATLPQYLYHSRLFLQNNIPSVVFLLYGIFYFLKAYHDKSFKHFVLSAIFMGTAALFRYEYSIIALFLLLIYLVGYADKKSFAFEKRSFGTILIGATVFILIISPIFILNNNLYGSFFKVGDIAYKERYLMGSLNNSENNPFPTISLNNLSTNLYTFFLTLYPLQSLYTLTAISALLLLLGILNPIRKIYALIFIFVALFLIFFFGNSEGYYGFGVTTLRASYVRYFLPIYLLMLPLISWLLLRIKYNKYIIINMIILITITSTFGSVATEMKNINQWLGVMKNSSDKILENTPEDALIVTMDVRLAFPYRKVAAYDPLLYYPEKIATKMIKLYETDIPVFFFENEVEYKKVNQALEKYGYTLQPMEVKLSPRQLYILSKK